MKNFKRKILAFATICCLTIFYACQNDEHNHIDETGSHESGLKMMSVSDVMALLKQEKIKNSILETTQTNLLKRGVFGFEGEEERQFEVLDMGDYINYSLYLDEYTEETPYYHFLVVTVNPRDNTEQAAYLRYRPEFPLEPFNPKIFTGRLEIYDIENVMQAAANMVDGRVNMGIVATEVCTTTTWITEVPCTHGGQHGIGESCSPGYINNAYIQINISTTCRTNYSIPPSMIGGYSGGGGGGGGASYIQYFYTEILRTQEQRDFYNNNKVAFNTFLNNHGGSHNFAKYLAEKGAAGDGARVLAFLNAWKTTSAMKIEYFKTYMSRNQYSPQSMDFVMWGTMYYKDNPTVTVDKFRNWFMGKVDGIESTEIYDAQYWQNSNLSFPQQQLPSAVNFLSAYPPRSKTAKQLCTEIGGQILTLHNNIVNSGQRMNTCAVRLSKALNYSGITLPNIPGKTKLGGDGKYYFTFASDITFWMMYTFGINIQNNTFFPNNPNHPNHPLFPDNPNHIHLGPSDAGVNGEGFANSLSESIGIFVMFPANSNFGASGHCDALLNGGCIGSNCYYDRASDIHVWLLD